MAKWVTVECPRCRRPNMVDPAATSEIVCSHCREKTLVVSTGSVGTLTGEVLGENYRIEDRIGQGGFGEVYRARDQLLQRPVAVKVLAQPTEMGAEQAGKFLREAITAAQIAHPNVVHVYDVGTEKKRGLHYLVMEFVDGRDLKERVEADGPLPEPEVVAIGLQIARGLAEAHSHGIVHRDIKPGNIMQTRKGGVKITDFGLARVLQVDHATKTQTAGSVAYMPPEQFEGKTVDERADLYAFGATLYFLLSGKTPYPGVHDFNVMYNILSREPTPLPDVAPSVSGPLWDLIRDLLAKDPAGRPSNAEEVIGRLEALLSQGTSPFRPCAACGALAAREEEFCPGCGKGMDVTSAPVVEETFLQKAPDVEIRDDRTMVDVPFGKSRRSWWIILGIVAAVAALVIVGISLLPDEEEPEPVPEPPPIAKVDPPPETPIEPPRPLIPAELTPEELEMIRRGDFEEYLEKARALLEDAEAPEELYRRGVILTPVEGDLADRLGGIAFSSGKLDLMDEIERDAILTGMSRRADGFVGDALQDALEATDVAALETVKEKTDVHRDAPGLQETAAKTSDAVESVLSLVETWKGRGPGDHYDRIRTIRARMRESRAALDDLGVDPSLLDGLAERIIIEKSILPELASDAVEVYDRIIPSMEMLAEIEGADLGTILDRIEARAGDAGIPVPW